MASVQHWICFECAQSSHANEVFSECTFCRIRLCRFCESKHLQSHNNYLVKLRKVSINDITTTSQVCVTCEELVILRYSCQSCSYAQCLGCWKLQGINRHEHRSLYLYEFREDYGKQAGIDNAASSNTVAPGGRKPSLPPRSLSTPAPTAPNPGVPRRVPLQKTQTQPLYFAPPPNSTQPPPPPPPTKKRHSITSGFKKAYAMSQKNAYTKVATAIAVGAVGVAIGTDISGIVDGLGALDFDSGGVDGADSTLDPTSVSDQGMADPGMASTGTISPNDLPNGAPQTTEWMQQQYWQNVQLPNLAGPSITPAMMNATM